MAYTTFACIAEVDLTAVRGWEFSNYHVTKPNTNADYLRDAQGLEQVLVAPAAKQSPELPGPIECYKHDVRVVVEVAYDVGVKC